MRRVTVRPPGDKSITHRVLVVAALAEGQSVLRRPLTSLDARSMAGALRSLGVRVSPLRGPAGRATVIGAGLGGLKAPRASLQCGNSGTTARLLLGVLSGTSLAARLTGDASLRRRPMRRVTEPLTRMGARFEELNGDGLPLIVRGGPLRPLHYDLPVASAQVKSALLLAGLVGRVPVHLTEPARSRDHTERLLVALGVPLERRGSAMTLQPVDRLPAFDATVPGDLSSAAFLMGAALLGRVPEVVLQGVGVNPTRAGVLRALTRMGADIAVHPTGDRLGEPTADVIVRPSELRAVEIGAGDVPSLIDELPILAVLASRAAGESVFRGVSELRVKESDRLALLARNLQAIGVRAKASADTLWITGPAPSPGGRVETAGDHRLAMAFATLGCIRGARVTLSERDSVAVSYPAFFADLAAVRGS